MNHLPKPDYPCSCGSSDWYWPGDYYWGEKVWLCRGCHPPPAGYIIKDEEVVKDE